MFPQQQTFCASNGFLFFQSLKPQLRLAESPAHENSISFTRPTSPNCASALDLPYDGNVNKDLPEASRISSGNRATKFPRSGRKSFQKRVQPFSRAIRGKSQAH